MECLQLQYLFEDRTYEEVIPLSDYDSLDVISHGCHLYGEILWPDGGFNGPRPCVILLHGFPGSARNDDLAHALCRIGCVVLTPHHRGAWGSEGEYLVSHCVEDALVLADYVRSPEFCRKYRADPDNVYFIGHSMGGCTALNAARQLPWLRGLVLLTPFDPTVHLREGEEKRLWELLEQGKILHSGGVEAIFQDIAVHRDALSFPSAYGAMKERNLLCIAGTADQCAPAERMFLPLWNLLRSQESRAVQRFVELPAGHGLLGCRVALLRETAQFLVDTLG